MNQNVINFIENKISHIVNERQLKEIVEILNDIDETKFEEKVDETEENSLLIERFIASKKLEGCSNRTLIFYKSRLELFVKFIQRQIKTVSTDEIRHYLTEYQKQNNCSNLTVDNTRRVLSSFFQWLEDENYILKSPIKRIKKIKSIKTIKEPYTDDQIQMMRDVCDNERDLAIIDFLSATGVRVGELVKLSRNDIDFGRKECVVFGKGGKERYVYFDSPTKIHLKQYLDSRTDKNDALFVSLLKPYNKLEISGVELLLKRIGKKLKMNKIHPHRFRRTLATNAIDKGMPIEQVQTLMGHSKVETTLDYAIVDQNNVKQSYRRYLG